MPETYVETEHQELFVPDADLRRPVDLHVPSALGPLPYNVCLRLPQRYAGRLEGSTVRLEVGGLRPDDVTCEFGENAPEPAAYNAGATGLCWIVFAQARVSRGDATLTFSDLPEGLERADVLLCTWPRFIASGQADQWLECREDPAWAPNGVPLGGIGCGKVEVSRDGRFRNFSGNNNQDMPFEEPDGLAGAYLSVAAAGEERVLATRPMGGLEPCGRLDADLAFPQATLTAEDAIDDLDVEVRLSGPTVPHRIDLASLPAALLRWRVTNRATEARSVRCRFAWPNLVGAGGGIAEPESRIGYADGYYQYVEAPDGHAADTLEEEAFVALRYSNAPNQRCPSADGAHYVAVRRGDGVEVDANPDRGSLTRTVQVPAGGSARVEMVLCWEMPHWVDSLGEERGLYWQNLYEDGPEMLGRLFDSFEEILDGAAGLRELLADTTLPQWLRRRLCNCCYPLVTNSVLYRDGRFSINEGPTEMAGCYGTIDQRLGAHPATQLLFPSLNAQELEEFAEYQSPNGGINHDLGGGHLEAGAEEQMWPDLTCSFILQTARHAWTTGDPDFEAQMWPRARRALLRHREWAEEGDGVAQVGEGLGTSYDGYHYHGTTPYMGTLWIAALQVCRKWARQHGDSELQEIIPGLIEAARRRMEEDLWNGRYYRAFGSPDGPQNDNSHAGMPAGEVFARMLAGGDVLPQETLDSCLEAWLDLNGSDRFAVPPDEVSPAGEQMVEYGWLPYVEAFGLSALAVTGRDFMPVWRRIIEAMDADGRRPCDTRLMYRPANGEPSWGSYYMTAPASWLVYDAWLDFCYAPQDGTLRLLPGSDGRYAVVHPLFWGIAERSGDRMTLDVRKVFAGTPLEVNVLEVARDRAVLVGDQGEEPQRQEVEHCYRRCVISSRQLIPGERLAWRVVAST